MNKILLIENSKGVTYLSISEIVYFQSSDYWSEIRTAN